MFITKKYPENPAHQCSLQRNILKILPINDHYKEYPENPAHQCSLQRNILKILLINVHYSDTTSHREYHPPQPRASR